MIELKNTKQLENAILRARSERKDLIVKTSKVARRYFVENKKSGKTYEINFKVSLGKRFGHCTCPAGEFGIPCKHLVCAAGLNLYLARQGVFKQENQTVS